MSDEWQIVGASGKPRRAKRQKRQSAKDDRWTVVQYNLNDDFSADAISLTRDPVKDRAALVKAVDSAKSYIKTSKFFSCLSQAFEQIATSSAVTNSWSVYTQLVIYGLGSIQKSKVSQHQLALGLLLREEFLSNTKLQTEAFDPVFTELDKAVLSELGITALEENEGCKRLVEQPTFFYMPHCEAVLCDALLQTNFDAMHLPQMAILGNSFNTYHERWSLSSARKSANNRPAHMLKLVDAGLVIEADVPECEYPVTSAFNDMALHAFRGCDKFPTL